MPTEKSHTHATRKRLARTTTFTLIGSAIALGGCALEPQGPTPIRRLPADQSNMAGAAHPLTPEERERYEANNRQVMAEQNQAIARDATAQAMARAATPPVTVYGGYFGGWRGPAWSVGIGNPGWGPGWGRPGWGRPGWGRPGWGVGSSFAGWGWGGGGMGWGMGWGW
jgi:hypothetical protein